MAAVQLLLKRLKDKTRKLRENSDSDIKHANRALPPLPPHYIDEYGFGADGKRTTRACDSPSHIYEEIPDFIVPTVTIKSKIKRSPEGDTDSVPSIGDKILTQNHNHRQSSFDDLRQNCPTNSASNSQEPESKDSREPNKIVFPTELKSKPKKSFQVNDVFFQAAQESRKSADSADISSSDYNGSCDSYGSAISSTSPTSSKRGSIKSGNSVGNASNGTFNEYDINADLDNLDDIDTAYTFSPSDGFHDSGGSFGDIEDKNSRTREYHLYDDAAKSNDKQYFDNLNFCQCSQCYQAEIAEQYSDKSDTDYDYFLAKVHQNHTLKQQVIDLIKSSTESSDSDSVSHTLPNKRHSRKLPSAHASSTTDFDFTPPFSSPSEPVVPPGHAKKSHTESGMFRKKVDRESTRVKHGNSRVPHSVQDIGQGISATSTLKSASKRTTSHKAERRRDKEKRKTLEEILSLDDKQDHEMLTSSKDDITINTHTKGAFDRTDRLSCRVTNFNPNKLRQNPLPLTLGTPAPSGDLYGSMYGNNGNAKRHHSNRMLSDMIRQNNHRQSFLHM